MTPARSTPLDGPPRGNEPVGTLPEYLDRLIDSLGVDIGELLAPVAVSEPPATTATPEDLLGLVELLRTTGRFARDTSLGRILHPGRMSLRELTASHSLHIVVSGTGLSAHRDRFSPVRTGHGDWIASYGAGEVIKHAVGILLDGLLRLVGGRRGPHRVRLDLRPAGPVRPRWRRQDRGRSAGPPGPRRQVRDRRGSPRSPDRGLRDDEGHA